MLNPFFSPDILTIPLGVPKYIPPVSSLTTIRSTFFMISFLKELAFNSDLLIFTGLIFAKRFNSDLSLSKPVSGRKSLEKNHTLYLQRKRVKQHH